MQSYDVQALIATIYRYYPRNVSAESRQHQRTEESRRLHSVLTACARTMGEQAPGVLAPGPIDNDVAAVIAKLQRWPSFVARLRREHSGYAPWNTTLPWVDPCYSCRIVLPGVVPDRDRNSEVVCLLSILAPVYAVYASHFVRDREMWIRYSEFPAPFQEHQARLAARIEETFGFARLREDSLFMPIPDVQPYSSNVYMGEAKLIDCIFTSHRF